MDNPFFLAQNPTERRHLQSNPLFEPFCLLSKALATSSSNEEEMITKARTIYVDQFKITAPPWDGELARQWKEMFGKNPLPTLNVYYAHVNNPSGNTDRGPKFSEFIQDSHEWTENCAKEIAVATAEIAYKSMVERERKLGAPLDKPLIYPAWCARSWEEYFYTIACTDACRHQQRKKRRLQIEDTSAKVMEEAAETILAQMADGSTEDVKNVSGAYTGAAQVYQRLYLNNEDFIPKKNT